MSRLALAGFISLLAAPPALGQFQVVGQCRGGVPNGAYELHAADGSLRVAGAFSLGRKTGTFIFWTGTGARVAVIPYDDDAKSGTVALWYTAPGARAEAGRKLEAPYVDDRLHGIVRSWHPGGTLRAEYRYERGALTAARAWSEAGAALSETQARSLAARDAENSERFVASLLTTVRDHLPECDESPDGEPPRS